jgi:hypothetical protein
MKQLTPVISKSCDTCDWKRDTTYIKGCCCDLSNDCSGEPDCNHWHNKQLTPAEEEAYVRARWEGTVVRLRDSTTMDKGCGLLLGGTHGIYPWTENWSTVWHAAYLFTRQREAEIAQRERGIAWLGNLLSGIHQVPDEVVDIIAREQTAIAELKRGTKEQG